MKSLLDVNVLIALLDPHHFFHTKAHQWWKSHSSSKWVTCPLTENGFIRIMSNPNYSKKRQMTVDQFISLLRDFQKQDRHEFWPDSISLLDPRHFDSAKIHSSRKITDLYLLGLAVFKKARFVTFDQSIDLHSIPQAKPQNLHVIQ